MTTRQDLKPTGKPLTMHLLHEIGVDVSQWPKMKNGDRRAASNPKYCYNWSFEQSGELIVACLWYRTIKEESGDIVYRINPRSRGSIRTEPGGGTWNRRAAAMDAHIALAYSQRLPLRVIVVDGRQRNPKDTKPKASEVDYRLLDPVAWAVKEYDFATGECLLVRGAIPEAPATAAPDIEMSWFEGWRKQAIIYHRSREAAARREKIKAVKAASGGKLVCEVPRCGFDFGLRYGALGEGYVQVHHILPLSKSPKKGREIRLKDLAVVCANCHVMIHFRGDCRPLENLIPV